MTLSLQEALTRKNLSIDEYNGLLPQAMDAVLAMEGAGVGATVGSWVIIKDDEGHSGFESEYPGIFGLSQLCRVLRLEPGLIAISIKTASELELDGIADYRQAEEKDAGEAEVNESIETVDDVLETVGKLVTNEGEELEEGELEKLADRMVQMDLMMVGWLLNTDLITFLSGEPVQTHEEVREAMLADFATMGAGDQDTAKKPKRKKKRSTKEE